jgi:hypothetical protein
MAIAKGKRDYYMAIRDPWLDMIRNDEEFKKLIDITKSSIDEQRKLIEKMDAWEEE